MKILPINDNILQGNYGFAQLFIAQIKEGKIIDIEEFRERKQMLNAENLKSIQNNSEHSWYLIRHYLSIECRIKHKPVFM